jgi:hypothetical protein
LAALKVIQNVQLQCYFDAPGGSIYQLYKSVARIAKTPADDVKTAWRQEHNKKQENSQ